MVLDGKYLLGRSVNAGVPQDSILGSTLFFFRYIYDLPENITCNVAVSVDDTTLYSKRDWTSICGSSQNSLPKFNLTCEI